MAGNWAPWDANRPYAGANPGNWWNGGCPPGYFAQFVSPTFVADDGTLPSDYGNPASRVICRLISTTTPDTIAAETGVTWTDAMQNFNDALKQTLTQVSGQVFQGIGASLPWILVAAVIFLYLNTKQR
jgi:phospholipase/lecithinase/hemolysin